MFPEAEEDYYQVSSPFVWDGGGSDANWTTAANWAGGVAPTANAEDVLCFAGTPPANGACNDFAAGTAFKSIEFAASGFNLTGNSFTLSGGITVAPGVAAATISTDVAAAAPITVDVADPDAMLTISGVFSGTGSLTKTGDGTLALPNDTHIGDTIVSGAGKLTTSAGAAISGVGGGISGTEIYVGMIGLPSTEPGSFIFNYTFTAEVYKDGVKDTCLSPTVAAGGNWVEVLVDKGLERNTAYDVRVIATNNNHNWIYDSGTVSTKDAPDTSGWYRISSNAGPLKRLQPLGVRGFARGAHCCRQFISNAAGYFLGSLPKINLLGMFNVYVYSGCPFTIEDAYSFGVAALATSYATLTTDPIQYFDGNVDYSVTDLQSDGLADSFTQSRSWTAQSQWAVGQRNGNGWINNSLPTLQQGNGDSTIYIIRSATEVEEFDLNSSGNYVPAFYNADALTHDADTMSLC